MTATTYHAPVHVYRLGSYKFKGSPDEVPMAHIVLEAFASRKFSSGACMVGMGAAMGVHPLTATQPSPTYLPDHVQIPRKAKAGECTSPAGS